MAHAGVANLFVANQVVGQDKLRALASLARDCLVTVAVDDERQVALLTNAATTAEAELGVVVEIDVGMGRAGVRSAEEACRLAEEIAATPKLAFRGVHGYEGHCMTEPDQTVRDEATRAANRVLTTAARRLAAAGHHCEIVTAGGTGTFRITGADTDITDVQVGSYVLMDTFHGHLVPNTFEVALTVAGTVTSRQSSTVVLDVGRKSISTEFGAPPLVGLPNATIRSYAEEHCTVEFDGRPPVRVGDTVEVVTTYAPTAVNLHDVFHVIENGIVVDIWPVSPRGPGPILYSR